MIDTHLSTVKNIPGRRWNIRANEWEVPYTKLTLRFIAQYLEGVAHLNFILRAAKFSRPTGAGQVVHGTKRRWANPAKAWRKAEKVMQMT